LKNIFKGKENDAMDVLQDSVVKSFTNLNKLKDIKLKK